MNPDTNLLHVKGVYASSVFAFVVNLVSVCDRSIFKLVCNSVNKLVFAGNVYSAVPISVQESIPDYAIQLGMRVGEQPVSKVALPVGTFDFVSLFGVIANFVMSRAKSCFSDNAFASFNFAHGGKR